MKCINKKKYTGSITMMKGKGRYGRGSRYELVTEQQGIKKRNDCSFRIFFVPYNRTLRDRKTTDVLHQQ